MISIQEALRELNKRSLKESTERDDIDADRDDKVEKAKDNLEKVIDDADADRDYKLKEGFNSLVRKKNLKESKDDAKDCLHNACIKLNIDYDTIGYTKDGKGYIIGKDYTKDNIKDIVDLCSDSIKSGNLEKLIKDNDSMIFTFKTIEK